MTKYLTEVWRAWDRFWFKPVDLVTISLFRILFGVGGFAFYFSRQFHLEEWFSELGMLPLNLAKEVYLGKFHAFYFNFPTDPSLVRYLHILFLISLLGIALGFFSRFWATVGFILHILFLQRNFTILWGADKIASFWFLYLMLSESDRKLSLRALLFPGQKREWSQGILTPVAYRLIQIQLCIVYAYSGLEKLKGPTWWYGSALWNIVTNGKMMPFDTTFIAHFPLLLVLGCYLTLIFEIYFPMAIWVPRLRTPWLLFGVAFHFMIGVLMDLMSFSFLMCIGYLFFVNAEKIRSLLEKRVLARHVIG